MSVRVVVVTYFPGPDLDAFLHSLEAAAAQPVPVTVVDNGSTDGSVERAAARTGVTVMHSGANIGFGAAANLGVSAAGEDFVLIANPDLVFEPGALDALLQAADRWPDAGALGPAIRTSDDLLYPSARQIPSIGRGVGHALCGWWWPSNPWTAAYRQERGAPQEGATGWLSGSCLLVRRAAFEQVGGFDPGFFMYVEDLDLCERIGHAGWQIVYVPSALIVHAQGQSTQHHAMEMSKAHHDSWYRYLARRYHGWRWAPVRLVLRLGLGLRYQLSRRHGRVAAGATPTRDADALRRAS